MLVVESSSLPLALRPLHILELAQLGACSCGKLTLMCCGEPWQGCGSGVQHMSIMWATD
jgi:hypothetical protein